MGHEVRSVREAERAPWRLSRAIRAYMADYESRGNRDGSTTRERACLDRVLRLVGDLPLTDVRKPVALEYRRHRLNDGAAVRTVNKEVETLKRCLAFAVEMDELERSPLVGLRRLPVKATDERRARRSMTDDECDRFVAASWALDAERIRNGRGIVPLTPLWLTLLGTGARKKATCGLRWKHWQFDVDLSERGDESVVGALVEYPGGLTKTGKGRVLPVGPEVADAVEALKVIHRRVLGRWPGPGDPVFRTTRGLEWKRSTLDGLIGQFRAVLRRAEIPERTERGVLDIHACRKTYSTRLYKAGVSLEERKELLGHAHGALTQITYTDHDVDTRVSAVRTFLEYDARRRGLLADETENLIAAVLGSGERKSGAALALEPRAAGEDKKVKGAALRADDSRGNPGEQMKPTTYQGGTGLPGGSPAPRSGVEGGDPTRKTECRADDPQSVPSPSTRPSTVAVECGALPAGLTVWLEPEHLAELTEAVAALARGERVALLPRRKRS